MSALGSLGDKLEDLKIAISHKRSQFGRLANLVNPHHRHDEPHEIACDEKRTAVSESHRFHSYFPDRAGNNAKWYVDGRDYFWAVSVALENAKELIYIADWWLSPELFLRRPPANNKEWRLDKILKRKAEAGVKIYIQVYREVESALTCNSLHSKHALQALCPEGSPGYGNISIMRHPDHNFLENAADMTMYWAHHEKFLVIDYRVAFLGGLDLCFGRWDLHQHPLADAHPEGVANEIWPGQDFNNNRIMDFKGVEEWKQNELSKADNGRMPWHDVAVALVGPCVYDIAEHFVLRWNFTKREKYKRDKHFEWLELEGRDGPAEDIVGVQRPKHPVGGYTKHPLTPLADKDLLGVGGPITAQLCRSACDWSAGILTEHSIQNAYAEVIRAARHYVYIENQFFITSTGPTGDEELDKQSQVHNTIGAAIVDAVVAAAREQRPFRIIAIIPAVPGFAGDLREDAAIGTRAIMDYQYKSICRGEHSIFGRIRAHGIDPTQYIFFFNLRSYDRLNRTRALREQEEKAGVSYQELQRANAEEQMSEGIHGTYEHAWDRDRHMGRWRDQRNQDKRTPDAQQALDAKARFEAVGNEMKADTAGNTNPAAAPACASADTRTAAPPAEIGANAQSEGGAAPGLGPETQTSASVAHHAMDPVPDSDPSDGNGTPIITNPTADPNNGTLTTTSLMDEPWEGMLAGQPGEPTADEVDNWIQEELYVHSKLLIADDRIVICGSANINDRSQLGDHDSETALVLQDTQPSLPSRMAGTEYMAGSFAAGLRRYLWREHMGLMPPQALDASSDVRAQPPAGTEGGVGGYYAGGGLADNEVDQDKWSALLEDPLGPELWAKWTEQASVNTQVFRALFHADPDDNVTDFELYNKFLPPKTVKAGHIYDRFMPPMEVREKLSQVKGHLVWMSMEFLRDAPMAEAGLQVNSFTQSIYT